MRQNIPAVGSPADPAEPAEISADALSAIVAEAIARWNATTIAQHGGIDLSSTPVHIVDLPGEVLGQAWRNLVLIDRDAAGHGWFIDATPADDVEFPAANGRALGAVAGIAAGRMDLLTVVMHEFGHILGLPDLDPAIHDGDLMVGTLGAGERRSAPVEPRQSQHGVESPEDGLDSTSRPLPSPAILRRNDPDGSRIPQPAAERMRNAHWARDLIFAQMNGTVRPSANHWLDDLANDIAGGGGEGRRRAMNDALDDLLGGMQL